MSTTPRPAQVQSDLHQIVTVLAPAVLQAYRWAYSVRFEAVRRGEGGSKGSDRTDPVAQAVCTCAPGQRGTCGRCRARSRIDHAARSVSNAVAALKGALADCDRAMKAADGGEVEEHTTHAKAIDARFPRLITQAEEDKAKAARARRARRGEGYGAA